GELIPSERLEEILARLDEALLLEGPRFQAHHEALQKAFREDPVRPATLAGKAYEADPEKLREELDTYFSPPEGPGLPEGGTRSDPLSALIAPHIDLERGGHSYTAAWRVAGEGPAPDAVVILGTAHSGYTEGLFIGARKAFATPLGESPVERELMEALAAERGEGLFADEFAHAQEHSVEFQVLFLQHLFGATVPILPFLVCSFHEFVTSGKEPHEDERVSGFVEAFRKVIEASGKRVMFVASADLAHVGPKFGDSSAVDGAHLGGIRQSDMELLKRAGELDAPGFFGKIARNGDRTRVCGFPSIYTLIRLLDGQPVRGVLRKYGNTIDPTGSAVTFAGMTFEA
ncbi:MAG: AmmeMemoRadiSam system protein B, partial [Planctomycetota bacterium]